jgi:hypothetical protein
MFVINVSMVELEHNVYLNNLLGFLVLIIYIYEVWWKIDSSLNS